MSNRSSLRVAAHFREAFDPAPSSQEIFDRFFQTPGRRVPLYSVDYRSVPANEVRTSERQVDIARAGARLYQEGRAVRRTLGRNALTLSRGARVASSEDIVMIYFDVINEQQPALGNMLDALNEIEAHPDTQTGLYLRIARSSLVRDIEARRAAGRYLNEQLAAGAVQLGLDSARIVRDEVIIPQSVIDPQRAA